MKQLKYRLPLLYLATLMLGLHGCAPYGGKGANNGLNGAAYQSQGKAGRKGQTDSLWQRVFDLYALPTFEHEAIDHEVAWFVEHPSYIARVQERAGIYLHSIVEQIDRHDIPGEIALLPVVESAFRPEAYSPKDAAGLWQFIPSTGRQYGLRQNRWYDGRRDVFESTQAAIRYLKKLRDNFGGDWLLALAAYNAGEGAVTKAIKHNQDLNKPTDFWSLTSLPQETKAYVPRLLAVARLFSHAQDYHLTLQHIPNKPTLEPIAVGPGLDLHKAANMADISLEEMQVLNPGFSHGSTGPEEHTLLIPVDKSNGFKEQLSKIDWSQPVEQPSEASEPAGSFHLVRRGETLAQIAQKYGTSAPAIRRANHLASNKLQNGTQLLIPASEKAVHKENMQEFGREIALAPSKSPGEQLVNYTARGNDTLKTVASRFGVGTDMLMRWNNLKSDKLAPGKNLVIWTKSASSKSAGAADARDTSKGKRAQAQPSKPAHANPANKSVLYTVRGGDTLATIAKHFKVNADELRKWNSARLNKGGLKPGVVLMIMKEG